MAKGYKYRGGVGILDENKNSIFERDVTTIENNQIYLPTIYDLNDPTEGFYNDDPIVAFLEVFQDDSSEVKKHYLELLAKIKNVGIYSLSKNHDNELLWAYYASGHTGFSIEYDIDILKESLNFNSYFPFVFDFDVNYVQSISQTDILELQNKDINQILKTYLGTKSESWFHEEEYRLIFEGKGLFDFDYRAVTGIYFGYRMHEQEIDYIMNKLKGRGLLYYKMELIDKTYKFYPKQIEDRYSGAPRYFANCIDYDIDELLMCGGIFGDEVNLYRDKFIEAIELIKNEPLIKNFYIATINMNFEDPLLIIWAYTKSGFPPCKEFNFKLDSEGKIRRVK